MPSHPLQQGNLHQPVSRGSLQEQMCKNNCTCSQASIGKQSKDMCLAFACCFMLGSRRCYTHPSPSEPLPVQWGAYVGPVDRQRVKQ
jgi:hypothetical protein